MLDRIHVLFPLSVLASVSGVISRHRDAREVTLDLYGMLLREKRRLVYVPSFLIGTGIDRVRRVESCNTDAAFRQELCDQISTLQDFPQQQEWMQLGNVHRHPGEHCTPSRHTDVPTGVAYLGELPDLPAYLTGIVHLRNGRPHLRMHAIDRQGVCATVPWSVADLPTVASVLTRLPRWISAPLTRRARERWLATRSCAVQPRFGANGGLTIDAARGDLRGRYHYPALEGGPACSPPRS